VLMSARLYPSVLQSTLHVCTIRCSLRCVICQNAVHLGCTAVYYA
jgi:hypothetical protein